jgi:6-phosphofructokinase 1
MPTGYDRLLATRFGATAITAIANEEWGKMVALQSPHLVMVPIEEVIQQEKRVDPTHDLVQAARAIGINLGD